MQTVYFFHFISKLYFDHFYERHALKGASKWKYEIFRDSPFYHRVGMLTHKITRLDEQRSGEQIFYSMHKQKIYYIEEMYVQISQRI